MYFYDFLIITVVQTTDITATGGSDYTTLNGLSVTVMAGQTEDIVITINNDNEPDNSEQFNVALSGDVGFGITTVVVTIYNDREYFSSNFTDSAFTKTSCNTSSQEGLSLPVNLKMKSTRYILR